MTKAVVRFGYDQFVMEAVDALKIHELLAKAERFDRKYRHKDEGGSAYYIWEQDNTSDTHTLELIPDTLYRMAKLAGKPEDK